MNVLPRASASAASQVRHAPDRRWSSDRRSIDRRIRKVAVAIERRQTHDRRGFGERRSGLDRRGDRPSHTTWYYSCSQDVGEHRRCGQPALLRDRTGWRCFWHLSNSDS